MNLDLIKLSHYNIPHLVEDPRSDWISFGEDNLYPNYLLDLFLGSAINGALVKSIGAMIYGEGLAATNAEENTDTKESFLRLNELLHNSDDDVLKDLAMDLKLFGGCYVNVVWSRDRTSVAKMKHIPAQYIRSGKMVDGEVDNYYYSADWSKYKKAEYKPRAYKAFNLKDRSQASQILMIRDKNPALFYGFAPDYVAATDWIQMELEIAQFHLSNITSGMTPSMHVGFSNGVPTEEERRTIERQLNQKFSGSGNAGKILITFNDGKETAPVIEPIQMNDAQSAWEGMSKQAVSQILAGHRVTSPILFGIRSEGGGLGNNADELRDAYSLFNNTVIIPFQNTLLKGLDKIFKVNDINLDLYFQSLKPADFIDLEVTQTQSEEDQEKEGVSKEDITEEAPQTIEDETGQTDPAMEEPLESEASYNGAQISSAIDIIAKVQEGILTKEQATVFLIQFLQLPPAVAKGFFTDTEEAIEKLSEEIVKKKTRNKTGEVKQNLSDDEFAVILENLKGEQIDEDIWEIVDEQDEGLIEDHEEWADSLIKKIDKEKFADEISSKPDGFSYLDKSFYKIRFKYYKKSQRTLTPSGKPMSKKSRPFCENMMQMASNGTVYRIEDIDKASREGVNKNFGHKGRAYDLFKYKGGVYCLHAWKAVLYRLKAGSELREGQGLGDYKTVKSIPKTYEPTPRGIKEAKEAAKSSNNWWRYPGSKN
jgi:hypothetical protein